MHFPRRPSNIAIATKLCKRTRVQSRVLLTGVREEKERNMIKLCMVQVMNDVVQFPQQGLLFVPQQQW